MILDASNIKIFTKEDGDPSYTQIAMITQGRVAFSFKTRETTRFSDEGAESFIPGTYGFRISGNSKVEMATGHSFHQLLTIALKREKIKIQFALTTGWSMTSDVVFQNLDSGGTTGSDTEMSYTLIGSGKPTINKT